MLFKNFDKLENFFKWIFVVEFNYTCIQMQICIMDIYKYIKNDSQSLTISCIVVMRMSVVVACKFLGNGTANGKLNTALHAVHSALVTVRGFFSRPKNIELKCSSLNTNQRNKNILY